MPNRRAQKVARKRARRKLIKNGVKAIKARARRIADEVAELGPEVAVALAYFRKHDLSPATVRQELMTDRTTWVFSYEGDVLTVDRQARDMILGLMSSR